MVMVKFNDNLAASNIIFNVLCCLRLLSHFSANENNRFFCSSGNEIRKIGYTERVAALSGGKIRRSAAPAGVAQSVPKFFGARPLFIR